MDQKELQPVKQINELTFYKYPYLEILISTHPETAIYDLWKIWTSFIVDQESAASVLQILIDQERKTGIQILFAVHHPELSLPEGHRLTAALLSLDRFEEIYLTPRSGNDYSSERLKKLFQI